MRDGLSLGCAPYEENPAQVGSKDYEERSLFECMLYVGMLQKLAVTKGIEDADIRICANGHDFGTYREVYVYFETTNQAEVEFAFWLDENVPAKWGTEEKKQLEEFAKAG